jgi:tRNA threonylcarbamoyladenosine biosynthesis protein TsaB
MTGLSLETATEHVEVLVSGPDDRVLAHRAEDVAHGHTRRLAALVAEALKEARVRPADLEWVAADLGPGSFTGVRVGLATARALALVSGAECRGASSLAALAHAAGARRAVIVPLVPAGRRDVYAAWFRADARGRVSVLAAAEVGAAALVVERTREVLALVPGARPRFVGPGVAREKAALEAAFPGATEPEWRAGGLSAHDLASAAGSRLGTVGGAASVRAARAAVRAPRASRGARTAPCVGADADHAAAVPRRRHPRGRDDRARGVQRSMARVVLRGRDHRGDGVRAHRRARRRGRGLQRGVAGHGYRPPRQPRGDTGRAPPRCRERVCSRICCASATPRRSRR